MTHIWCTVTPLSPTFNPLSYRSSYVISPQLTNLSVHTVNICSLIQLLVHLHTHTHSHSRARARAHPHTHTSLSIWHTHTLSHTHTHTHAHTHTNTHTHQSINLTHAHSDTRTHTHTHTPVYQFDTHTHSHTHTHTQLSLTHQSINLTHTHSHAHTHTHTLVYQFDKHTHSHSHQSIYLTICPRLYGLILEHVVSVNLTYANIFLGAFKKWRKVTVRQTDMTKLSVCLSVCSSVCPPIHPSAWGNSAPTGRKLLKFDIWEFFGNLVRKLKFYYTPTVITSTLHEDVFHIYDNISLNSSKSEKCFRQICRENQNTFWAEYLFSF
jgi:hypothetical protein